MRWKYAIIIRSVACFLLTALPAVTDEVRSSELYPGPHGGSMANDYCQGDCGVICDCEPPTDHSAYANLLWLGRSNAAPNDLIITPTDTLLNATDLQFNVAVGVEMGIRSKRRNERTWELRYFGIFDQDARERRNFNDGDPATTDASIVHFDAAFGSYNSVITDYSSSLHSGEVNVWLREWWGFEPVVGFRWFRQDEGLETYANRNAAEASQIDIANNLYGGQVGVRRVLWQTASRCRVDATVKGGVYYNDLQFDSEVRTLGVTIPTFNQSSGFAAYGGEIAVTATYRCSRNCSFSVGYAGLWLDGVGLAANQMDNFSVFSNTGNVDLSTLIYQGGRFGVEVTW